jgi:hypothetical protein
MTISLTEAQDREEEREEERKLALAKAEQKERPVDARHVRRDELAFFFGVFNVALTAFWMGRAPETYYKVCYLPGGVRARCLLTRSLTDTFARWFIPVLDVQVAHALHVAIRLVQEEAISVAHAGTVLLWKFFGVGARVVLSRESFPAQAGLLLCQWPFDVEHHGDAQFTRVS